MPSCSKLTVRLLPSYIIIISCGYRQSVSWEEANGPPSTDYMNCC
ncbi:hypothetical protein C427_5356 [Paraglaciecola psychrophila 170]|uniref:Uncharacterized protein n=1 Tax=Paraglaciecola psychrophila 170 TaxID=1129794 RepID=K7AEA0_9ALTE|nr:hypothetical protein C427_5356 [Paraglaciecola psychrophila 170]GAC40562.1 hypothetical protein GPSY_4961 [Paraglaciecola psychrophila 170]